MGMSEITEDVIYQDDRNLRRSIVSMLHPDVYMSLDYVHEVITAFKETAHCTLEDTRRSLATLVVLDRVEFNRNGKFKLISGCEI